MNLYVILGKNYWVMVLRSVIEPQCIGEKKKKVQCRENCPGTRVVFSPTISFFFIYDFFTHALYTIVLSILKYSPQTMCASEATAELTLEENI